MGYEDSNMLRLMSAFVESMRRGDLQPLEDRMASELVWEGLRPDLVCHSRDEAMRVLRAQAIGEGSVHQMEFINADDKVVLGIGSPQITEVAGEKLDGSIFQVFTFAGGRIVKMQDFRTRDAAMQAAGISG